MTMGWRTAILLLLAALDRSNDDGYRGDAASDHCMTKKKMRVVTTESSKLPSHMNMAKLPCKLPTRTYLLEIAIYNASIYVNTVKELVIFVILGSGMAKFTKWYNFVVFAIALADDGHCEFAFTPTSNTK